MHSSLKITGSKGKKPKGKLIVLAVCGSVAAVKSFELCRELMRKGASVQVVMSEAATKLISEDLMHYASGRKVITKLTGRVEHVEFFGVKGKADLLLICPATANTISKIAMGIDDTTITTLATTAIGSGKPVIIVPAMHYSMWEHPIVEENLKKLKEEGRVKLINPLVAEGKAKIAETDEIVLEVERALSKQKLERKRVLVTAGPTWEEIDPIRILTSKSSGKTGKEIAREAYRQGASVTVIQQGAIEGCIKNIEVKGSREMMGEVLQELKNGCDILICPAAISDFTVKKSKNKLKSGKKVKLELTPNKKLIELVRKQFPRLFIAGFKAETNLPVKQLIRKGKIFLKKKKLQLVVANDVGKKGIGEEENEVIIIPAKGKEKMVKGTKTLIAEEIVSAISNQFSRSK